MGRGRDGTGFDGNEIVGNGSVGNGNVGSGNVGNGSEANGSDGRGSDGRESDGSVTGRLGIGSRPVTGVLTSTRRERQAAPVAPEAPSTRLPVRRAG